MSSSLLTPGPGETVSARLLEPFILTVHAPCAGIFSLLTDMPCMIFAQKISAVEQQPGQGAVLRALGLTAAATKPPTHWNTTQLGVVEPADTRIAIIPLASGACVCDAASENTA